MASRRRPTIYAGLATLALLVLWLVCVASVKFHEVVVGIAATAFSLTFAIFVIRDEELPFDPTLHHLLECWRLLWYVLSGTAEIVVVLFKDLLGHRAQSLFRADPFDTGDEADGRATARRVLAIAYTTVAPNFIVIGIDCKQRQMLFHQVERSGVPRMTQNLGARA
jgi:multisubunit Na+/H+ antiporter MnhE subunit